MASSSELPTWRGGPSALRRLLPLNRLPHKLRLRIARDVLGLKKLKIKTLGNILVVPIQVKGIGTVLSAFGHRELDQYYIMQKMLGEGDTVLDIGANIGYYATIEGKLVGRSGFLYLFEPDPRNIEYLRTNLDENGLADRAEVHPDAVSRTSGKTIFQIAELANLNSIGKTKANDDPTQIARGLEKREYVEEIEVNMVSLVDFLENATRPVDLIRMDVEGHEVEILGDLADRLRVDPQFSRAPRCIVFEPHSWEYSEGRHLEPTLKTLVDSGYEFRFLGSRSEPNSPMRPHGLKPIYTAQEARGVTRGVYENVPGELGVQLAARTDGVTTVCLVRKGAGKTG